MTIMSLRRKLISCPSDPDTYSVWIDTSAIDILTNLCMAKPWLTPARGTQKMAVGMRVGHESVTILSVFPFLCVGILSQLWQANYH